MKITHTFISKMYRTEYTLVISRLNHVLVKCYVKDTFIVSQIVKKNYSNLSINRYRRIFNKRSKVWCPVPVKVTKQYAYIKSLQQEVIDARLNDDQRFRRKVTISASDPRRIKRHSAPVDPKPVAQLVAEHTSRFDTS